VYRPDIRKTAVSGPEDQRWFWALHSPSKPGTLRISNQVATLETAKAEFRGELGSGAAQFNWNLSFIHQLRRLGGNPIPGDRQMLLYAQAWLPLVTITLAAAILFGVASFMMTHAKP
jgi:hypothetical protein